MNIIKPIGAFFPVQGRDADSLLIAASSFERRCIGFASHLKRFAPEYRAESVCMIGYWDREDSRVAGRVKRYAPQLGELLARVARKRRVEHQYMSPYGILETVDFFEDLFSSLPTNSSVVVDISTITKLHLLYLLQTARACTRVAALRLVYTRARYGRYDTLSWGAEEPIVLPRFGVPRLDESQRSRLMMFCGLEPDRCYSVWRRFGQERCSLYFVDSGEDDVDRCANKANRLNSYAPEAQRTIVPAFRPDLIVEAIKQELAAAAAADEYLYISPLTTKWECVAVWEAFDTILHSASAAIAYSAPGRLNAAGHTRDELGECLAAQLW